MASFRARAGSLSVATFGYAAAVIALGCGPSMRTLVESDMRFERCYRIDDDPRAPLEAKRQCWREWMARYTKGQERSRVSYAEDRLRALDAAPTSAAVTSPGPTTAAIASPPPESPYAPPPPVVGPAGEAQSLDAARAAPACAQTCTDAWRGCILPCGRLTGCVVECDVRFKECMKSCP